MRFVGGGFDRFRVVFEIAGDQGGLARVADAGPARPADGHVARFGEFEQAAVVAVPGDREVAAGELDRRAVPGLPAGGWGALACAAAMPGVIPGAGPNGSVWMRAASIPIAARAALISSMKPAGPHRYAWALRGGWKFGEH